MKKEWIMPQASVETFSTNEYLSSCWEVACDTTASNKYEKKHRNSAQTHDLDHCGNPANQYLQDTDGIPGFDKMTEVGTDGLGKLPCTLYTNDSYNRKAAFSKIQPGDYIYWTTEAGSGRRKRTWHHQGRVQLQSITNPNRS